MSILKLDSLFQPQRVVLLGAPVGVAARALCDNLLAGAPPGLLCPADELACRAATAAAKRAGTVLVAADTTVTAARLERLCELGAGVLIWPHAAAPGAELMSVACRYALRVLGPRSPGVLLPLRGLAMSALPAEAVSGSLALIAQSQSVAAAAVDWAAGRRIGFSWVAATGGESDVDIADLLDYAALDSETHAVAIEVGRIGAGRKFMSAARACARAKPLVALQTQLDTEPGSGGDPVRSAALARAGAVECRSLPALFDAIAALQRLPPLHQARVLIAGNGTGICALGVDAVARRGLLRAEPAAAAWQRVRTRIPGLRQLAGAADLGEPPPADSIAALREFLADPGVDIVIFLRSPMAAVPHTALAEALAQAGLGERLLSVWLGLETALPARRICADAGLATFTSADAAARAVRYRWEYARNRELLTQTPPRGPATPAQSADVGNRLTELLRQGERELQGAPALELLGCYGVGTAPPAPREELRITVAARRHPELGQYLRIAPLTLGFSAPAGYGFMPLDSLLAQRMLADAGLCTTGAPLPEHLRSVAAQLQRLGQLLIEQPHLAELDLSLVARADSACCSSYGARLRLAAEPPPERQRLALAPYPAALAHHIERAGQRSLVRPVRPDDEPALIRLLQELDPETVRLRFFTYIRHFTHAMALRMTQIDYDRELALVIVPDGRPEQLDGIGTLVAQPDGTAAEFAVLISPRRPRSGLGRYLTEQLLAHARRTGVARVYGEVLSENSVMLGLARSLGFTVRTALDDPGVMHVEIPVGPEVRDCGEREAVAGATT